MLHAARKDVLGSAPRSTPSTAASASAAKRRARRDKNSSGRRQLSTGSADRPSAAPGAWPSLQSEAEEAGNASSTNFAPLRVVCERASATSAAACCFTRADRREALSSTCTRPSFGTAATDFSTGAAAAPVVGAAFALMDGTAIDGALDGAFDGASGDARSSTEKELELVTSSSKFASWPGSNVHGMIMYGTPFGKGANTAVCPTIASVAFHLD
mmetsp:Transcript_54328/g.118455  ORF Transcript_54328/g.118455 Transcript_54328/m.118455 type:complete len:214 (-) Transcript_54328:255-896(-)|eukprot:410021-Pleurochrysis_carterae.AAC.2